MDTDKRDSRGAAALSETSRGLSLVLVRQTICLAVRLSICNLIRRQFRRLQSEFFIGGY